MTFEEQLIEAAALPADYVRRRLQACTVTQDAQGRLTVRDTTGIAFSAEASHALADVVGGHFTATAPEAVRKEHADEQRQAGRTEIRRRKIASGRYRM